MAQNKFIQPQRISESNIQAEFYHQCKLIGLKCYLEYKVDNCRFDAIVLDDGLTIRYIIEFKSYSTFKEEKTDTKQIKKYLKYNIPIVIITRIEHVINAVQKINKNING